MWLLPHDGSLGERTVHSGFWYYLIKRNRANSLSCSCGNDQSCLPKKAIKFSYSLTRRLHMNAAVRWTYWSWMTQLMWEQHYLARLPPLGKPWGNIASTPVLLPYVMGTSSSQFPRLVFSFQLLLHYQHPVCSGLDDVCLGGDVLVSFYFFLPHDVIDVSCFFPGRVHEPCDTSITKLDLEVAYSMLLKR